MSQSANLIVFLLKPSMLSYFLIRKRVCQKLSWGGGGFVGKYPTPEPRKIGGCPMSGTHKAGKCPTVEPAGDGHSWN